LPHVNNRYSSPQLFHTLNTFAEHIYCSVLFEISITLFKILRAFRIKRNVHRSVWKLARLERSDVAKTDWWLLIATDIAEYLETFELIIWSHRRTAISAQFYTLTDHLALTLILQTILIKTCHWEMICCIYHTTLTELWYGVGGGVAMRGDQVWTHVIFCCLRSHTPYVYIA
jgi:hypothetical protein